MGHKGVSKRKLPKAKLKPPATANRGVGAVSGLAQSESAGRPLLSGKDGMSPSSGSKKQHKKNH